MPDQAPLFPKIVVCDAEIATNLIHKPRSRDLDFAAMEISVVCTFDYTSGDYGVFLKDNLRGAVDLLLSADMIVGFSICGFDNPLIISEAIKQGLNPGANPGVSPMQAQADLVQALNHKSYDLLTESRLGWGWTPDKKYPLGFKCEQHLEAMESMFGKSLRKTENGADAPRLWREGRYGQVIDYCLKDVRRERHLFEWAWYGGLFKCMAGPGLTVTAGHHVRRPQTMLGLENNARLPYFGSVVSDRAMTTILVN